MAMLMYSLLLGTVLLLGAPVWGWRMLRQRRYRAGLRQRLGQVPATIERAVRGRRVVWVHAVSVGEVLAAERMVRTLGDTLGAQWLVMVSTTTETGQQIARERFGDGRVFFWPLDFGWAVRRWLRALQPELLVLVESELWPRMLTECRRRGVPVAVVNARMSDRSFRRAMRVPALWRWMAHGVTVFLAQGEETAGRLRQLGAERVEVPGNLKFDLPAAGERHRGMAGDLEYALHGRKLVVAGSTLQGEEELLLEAWPEVLRNEPDAVLLIAPRHAQRFPEVRAMLRASGRPMFAVSDNEVLLAEFGVGQLILLDTLGQLADTYALAAVAFVGGSLVAKGGHNPLEAARFGVPVVMGPHYENFREIVEGMLAEDAITVVPPEKLAWALSDLLAGRDLSDGIGIGGRGKLYFRAQAGATERTVQALQELLRA